jgi:primosomal protein N' (replication factor Y)
MADQNVNLAIVGPYHHPFTYKVRPPDANNLKKGCRFLVPFGKSLKIGFFVEFQSKPVKYRLRYIKERIDTFSPFPEHLFDFCRWISDYYYAGLGETLAAALPGTGRRPKLEFVPVNRKYLEQIDPGNQSAEKIAKRILRYGSIKEDIFASEKEMLPLMQGWIEAGIIAPRYRVKEARKKLLGYRLQPGWGDIEDVSIPQQIKSLHAETIYTRTQMLEQYELSAYRITKLIKNNILEKVYDESGVSELSTYPIRWELPELKLLDGQRSALEEILPPIREKSFVPFLVFGITGSGKTLVYCHAAREAVEQGGSVLVMVPEIALSGLLLSSFAAFFGDDVVVMHSGLSPSQRFAVREKIASGAVRVVIGPRSAIFAPLKDLRLIIVDEEHDPSYKQDDPAPRYHGRDAAVMLARMVSCPIILGSASPSIESYHNAEIKRYWMITLDQRPKSGYRMPKIVTLDMKREKISGEYSFLSYQLKVETEKHIADGGQVIYYLNRRGYSPRLKCRECGEVPSCPDCGVTYTYHRAGQLLKCHFCDRIEPAPTHCDRCKAHDFIYVGAGTQRVEDNLAHLFSNIKAERIDSDKTASKSGRLILGDFAEEKFDLLIGTQMVTKGLDIPKVTLVGVLSADIGLDMPDFRASEKSYARLLQVSGRAGRGDREGLVMIQTYYTNNPVIRYLTEGSYRQFYDSIIEDRRQLSYPPFSRLINITLTGKDEKLLEKQAIQFRIKLEEHLAVDPVGGKSDYVGGTRRGELALPQDTATDPVGGTHRGEHGLPPARLKKTAFGKSADPVGGRPPGLPLTKAQNSLSAAQSKRFSIASANGKPRKTISVYPQRSKQSSTSILSI